jgi:hypothetical protein
MADSEALDPSSVSSDLVSCRSATEDDAGAIAALHADSWRRNYRGAYLDSYLDDDVIADRIEVWSQRLNEPVEQRITIVADLRGALVDFAHLVFDQDPTWGSLLDNLHVVVDQKRRGIGTLLLSAVATELLRSRPSGSLYLWVLDQNKPAQLFYGARGGVRVGSELRGPFPGGGRAMGHRYAWSEPSLPVPVDGGQGAK